MWHLVYKVKCAIVYFLISMITLCVVLLSRRLLTVLIKFRHKLWVQYIA